MIWTLNFQKLCTIVECNLGNGFKNLIVLGLLIELKTLEISGFCKFLPNTINLNLIIDI